MSLQSLLLLLTLLFITTTALYSDKSAVIQATDKTFNTEVKRHPGVVIVEFYAPWCGHCKNLAPEYDKAASNLKGVVKVVAVDATESPQVAQRYGVQGYPTIKVFGSDKTNPIDYQGARDSNGITSEGMKQVNKLVKNRKNGGGSGSKKSSGGSGSGGAGAGGSKSGGGGKSAVVELTDNNFNALVMESTDHWLVEFYAPWCGHCKQLAPEWEEAAKKLKGSVKLGAVDATVHNSLAQEYGIKGFPTIKLFSAGKKKKAKDYQGPREAAGIVDYALSTLDAAGVPPSITELTSSNVYNEKCGDSGGICVVMFVPHILDTGAAGRNSYISQLGDVAKTMRGQPIQYLWSEGGSQSSFESNLDINQNYPTVVVMSNEKNAAATMKISWSVKNLKSFVNGVLSGSERIAPISGGINKKGIVKLKSWDGKDGEMPEEIPLSDLFDDDEL